MPGFILEHAGKKYRVDAPDAESAANALRKQFGMASPEPFEMPKPPEGAIIHGGDGKSYSASDPSISVDRQQSFAGNADEGRAQMAELEALRRRSSGGDMGAARGLMPAFNGLSQGWGDEMVSAAAAATQPGSFADNRAVNQQVMEQELARERRDNPIRSTVTEIGGAVASAVPLASSAGLSASRLLPETASGLKGLAMRAGAGLADGLGYGALQGAGNAQEGKRTEGAITGALIGGAAGAAAPVIGSAIKRGSDIVGLSPMASRTRDRIAYLLQRSRMTPDDIGTAMRDAAADGQPDYMIADALGRAGRNEMGRLTRTASDTGDDIYRTLEARQLGAPRRMRIGLDEAATGQAGRTAQAAQGDIIAARNALADTEYAAARQQAGAVDVSQAIAAADNFLTPGSTGVMQNGSNIADDSIEAAVRKARSYLTDGRNQLSDFNAGLRAKYELDAMIENARPTVQRALRPIRDALDGALENASQPYAQARNNFRMASGAADAIDTGSDMFKAGRYEDNLRRFDAMPAEQQAGARVGYASRAVENIPDNPASDVTTGLRSTDRRAEIDRLLGPRVNRMVDRERQMFETYGEAAKNSATAMRLSEDAAGSGMGGLVMDAATFNGPGLMRRAAEAGLAALRGERESTRSAIAKLLMSQNGATATNIKKMLESRGVANTKIDAIVRALLASSAQTAAAQSQARP